MSPRGPIALLGSGEFEPCRAPVDVLAMDDGAALVLRPGRAPVQLGEGAITRFPAAAIDAAGIAG
jgi:hypothetical protein